MLKTKAKIIRNLRVTENYFKVILRSPQISRASYPGQFLNVKVASGEEPLLRRPLSVHRVLGTDIEILYEVVGKGSKILSGKKAGEYLDIIGPLGNGFSLSEDQYAILVAGGMGVAPLVFLAERLKRKKTLVLIGTKTKSHILCEQEFKGFGCEVKIATEDGSRGFKGYVTDLLKQLLTKVPAAPVIYACGPQPMLKTIGGICRERNISAQVSLEAHMACGIGACLGCVVATKEGYKRVCKEGPVFKSNQIVW